MYLYIAILFEVTGTVFMKYSQGFSKVIPSLLIIPCYLISLYFLTLSIKTIELSKAYTIWGGLGISLVFVLGVLFFGETLSYEKLFFTALIVVGVIGLECVA